MRIDTYTPNNCFLRFFPFACHFGADARLPHYASPLPTLLLRDIFGIHSGLGWWGNGVWELSVLSLHISFFTAWQPVTLYAFGTGVSLLKAWKV